MITVLVTASPIPSHPDTAIIGETLASVRHHLPDAPVWVLFDGVRSEQEHLREAYEQHIALVRSDGINTWQFSRHLHQVGMLRKVIGHIATPLILFVEQDAPLLTDRFIEWGVITDWLMAGRSNCIRLAHEEIVLPPHAHLFHGQEPDGPFIRTSQYSARPHIATVAKYREWLTYFSPHANTFLEDKLHGVVQENVKHHGWESEKLHLYAPQGGYRRSGHLDGRAGSPKYDDKLVF